MCMAFLSKMLSFLLCGFVGNKKSAGKCWSFPAFIDACCYNRQTQQCGDWKWLPRDFPGRWILYFDCFVQIILEMMFFICCFKTPSSFASFVIPSNWLVAGIVNYIFRKRVSDLHVLLSCFSLYQLPLLSQNCPWCGALNFCQFSCTDRDCARLWFALSVFCELESGMVNYR